MTPQLHHLLREQARNRPANVAIIDRSQSITYAELEAMAKRFADALMTAGLRPGDRAGLLLGKSIAAVAALFGILRCGAAYVPLDPLAPALRTARIIQHAELRALITTPARLDPLASCLKTPLPAYLLVDETSIPHSENFQIFQAPATCEANTDDAGESPLAYILYTSGSTGAPKGVAIGHQAALSFVHWAKDFFDLQTNDIVASHAPFHFDLSTFDLFATIAAGGTIALLPPSAIPFPASVAAWIEATGVTIWYSVPAALMQLVARGGRVAPAFPRLRGVLFAGEVFPNPALGELMRLISQARFFNLYGPTETNVCTVQEIAAPPAPDAPPVPIGKPCAHCSVRILAQTEERDLGEIVVAGPSLMQGYWRRPDLTAAACFTDAAGRRFYRTGDFGWIGEDGALHFAGRRDAQVKIRGHRVELGEIEAALLLCPAIEEAAAMAAPDGTLTAFVVTRPDASPDRQTLLAFCGERLPGYMVPRDFRVVSCLPRTSTGKLDRMALTTQAQRKESVQLR